MDISRRWAGHVGRGGVARGVEGLGRVDDFNVETGAKGLHVGDYEVAGSDHFGGGEVGGELGEAEGGEDAHDVCCGCG